MFEEKGQCRWSKKILARMVILFVLPVLVAGVARKDQNKDTKDVTHIRPLAASAQQKAAVEHQTRTMTYVYDEAGRLVGVDYGDSMVIIYSYDAAGNLLSRTVGRGSLGVGEGEVERPFTYELTQNYPNPFNPMTTIRYQIPQEGRVILRIYNILGQEVRTLVDEVKEAGEYTVTWDGKDHLGREVASGIFFSRIEAGRDVKTRKMIILK